MSGKKSDNFLRGWCRQLREALDEGGELAYETAELVGEALDLIEPAGVDGDPGGEVVLADGDAGEDAGETGRELAHGSEQAHQPDVPGLVGVLGHVPAQHYAPAGVPRGTGGGAASIAQRLVARPVKD